MTKKQVKILLIVIQALLLGMLFLPAAYSLGANPVPLSTFDLVRRYADIGYKPGSLVYIVLAVCCPVMSALSPLLLHDRKNFGVPACISALTCVVQACFSSTVSNAMLSSVRMTGQITIMAFFAFFSIAVAIYGFLRLDVPRPKDSEEKPGNPPQGPV